MTTTTSTAESVVADLVAVLDRAVRRLADTGDPIEANRCAAKGWSILRHDHPDHAERLNRTMHYISRREAELTAGKNPNTNPQET